MKLKLVRRKFDNLRTISDLYVNDSFFCNVLEDVDRGLTQQMSLSEIASIKVHGATAIPYGTYQVINSFSPRFNKYLPLLLNVPGYSGIRIHPSNTELDTEGCLLPGVESKNKVINSRATFARLFALLQKAEKTDKIVITITK